MDIKHTNKKSSQLTYIYFGNLATFKRKVKHVLLYINIASLCRTNQFLRFVPFSLNHWIWVLKSILRIFDSYVMQVSVLVCIFMFFISSCREFEKLWLSKRCFPFILDTFWMVLPRKQKWDEFSWPMRRRYILWMPRDIADSLEIDGKNFIKVWQISTFGIGLRILICISN